MSPQKAIRKKLAYSLVVLAVFLGHGLAGAQFSGTAFWKRRVPPTPPTVVSVSPVNGATNVLVTSTVVARFNMAMDASTLNTANFKVTYGGTPLAGTVTASMTTYPNDTVTFTPNPSLIYSTTFVAQLTTSVKSAGGASLASAYSWSFTVAAGGCFVAGTSILMANGTSKSIEEIQVGDEVISADTEGRVVIGRVLRTMVHTEGSRVLRLSFRVGDELVVVRSTPNHPFFTSDFTHTLTAENLRAGDEVFYHAEDGSLVKAILIDSVSSGFADKVYNFEVGPHHNYFAEGLLVHNKP